MRLDIINALSSALSDEPTALAAVRASGFPVGSIPAFRGSLVFWHAIVDAVENGQRPGTQKLLETCYERTQNPTILALMNGADERVEQIAGLMARLFHGDTEAKQLAARAGFPAHEIPRFENGATFWTSIVNAAAAGTCSVERLLLAARERVPYNPDVAALHESVRRQPIRPVGATPVRMAVDTAIAALAPALPGNEAVRVLCEAVSEARKALAVGDVERARGALGG
jgi:hypothetical protein